MNFFSKNHDFPLPGDLGKMIADLSRKHLAEAEAIYVHFLVYGPRELTPKEQFSIAICYGLEVGMEVAKDGKSCHFYSHHPFGVIWVGDKFQVAVQYQNKDKK